MPDAPVPRPDIWTDPPRTPVLPLPGEALRAGEGTVLSEPSLTATRPGLDRVARALLMPLLVLAVVTSPAFLGLLVTALVVGALVVWVVERLGLGRLFGAFGLLTLVRSRRARREPWTPPTLAFRYQADGRVREVRLVGHDTGVELGERVRVWGVSSRGIIHAVQLVNGSTGVTLRRHGLVRLVLLALFDVILLVIVAGNLVAR